MTWLNGAAQRNQIYNFYRSAADLLCCHEYGRGFCIAAVGRLGFNLRSDTAKLNFLLKGGVPNLLMKNYGRIYSINTECCKFSTVDGA